MAFPNLTLRTNGQLWAEATGTPDNGANTFQIGIAGIHIPDDNWLEIDVIPLGPSVQGASYVAASLNKAVDPPQITLNFTQAGADQATVRVRQIHTGVR